MMQKSLPNGSCITAHSRTALPSMTYMSGGLITTSPISVMARAAAHTVLDSKGWWCQASGCGGSRWSSWCSNTIRTACSRIPRGYGLPLVGMAPSSQRLEPPRIPGGSGHPTHSLPAASGLACQIVSAERPARDRRVCREKDAPTDASAPTTVGRVGLLFSAWGRP